MKLIHQFWDRSAQAGLNVRKEKFACATQSVS